jgi:hypothetical protein
MDNYFMTLVSVLRWLYNAFCLKTTSALATMFPEPDWYKTECKSALARLLFLHGLPDLYFCFQINKDLQTGCNIMLSKTSNNGNSYHKTLTSLISAPQSCLEGNFYYFDAGNAILNLWNSGLKSVCHTNLTVIQHFKDKSKIWDQNEKCM